jgi:hypothetical protein
MDLKIKKLYCLKWRPFFFMRRSEIFHRLGGITPFGVFSNAFPGRKMWDTFACATAIFLSYFIISIAVLKNVPPDAGLQKRATFPHFSGRDRESNPGHLLGRRHR